MRVIEMKLAGRLNKQNIPEYFATIHHVPGAATMTVTIIGPDSQREHVVETANPEDVFSMAQCLQFHLDGCEGTNSMVYDYYRLLQQFTD